MLTASANGPARYGGMNEYQFTSGGTVMATEVLMVSRQSISIPAPIWQSWIIWVLVAVAVVLAFKLGWPKAVRIALVAALVAMTIPAVTGLVAAVTAKVFDRVISDGSQPDAVLTGTYAGGREEPDLEDVDEAIARAGLGSTVTSDLEVDLLKRQFKVGLYVEDGDVERVRTAVAAELSRAGLKMRD